jgi:hypothetical protein
MASLTVRKVENASGGRSETLSGDTAVAAASMVAVGAHPPLGARQLKSPATLVPSVAQAERLASMTGIARNIGLMLMAQAPLRLGFTFRNFLRSDALR